MLSFKEIKFKDYKIHTGVYGNKEKKILLIHGAGKSKSDKFIPLMEDLYSMGYSTVFFDHYGHGKTGGNLLGQTLKYRIEEAEEVVKNYNINSNLNIISVSMGGYISVKLTETFNVKSLILVAPGLYCKNVIDIPFGEKFSTAIREKESWQNTDAWEILNKYKESFLLIEGENDTVIPKNLIRKCIESVSSNNKKLITVKDVSHYIFTELRVKSDSKFNNLLNEIKNYLK